MLINKTIKTKYCLIYCGPERCDCMKPPFSYTILWCTDCNKEWEDCIHKNNKELLEEFEKNKEYYDNRINW